MSYFLESIHYLNLLRDYHEKLNRYIQRARINKQ
jgi:hypothetical protein